MATDETMTKSYDLDSTLRTFAKSRQMLTDVYISSKNHFTKLREILEDGIISPESASSEDADHSLFLSRDEENHINHVLQKDPVIIISGQTNCGKTSLINELLTGSYLPTSELPCTARIVKLKYSEKNYLQIYDERGKSLEERVYFEKKKVPEQKIALDEADRDKKDEVECIVEVGLNHELLQNGLQIVDVPGLNENPALDDMVKKCLDGMLQLLIYVIDGKTSLRSEDTKFISRIKIMSPRIDIIYVCNKVEDDEKARKMDAWDDDETELEELPDRAKMAYDKLVKAGLVSSNKQYAPTSMSYYHGLSCVKIRRNRVGKKVTADEREKLRPFTDAFNYFKSCLLERFASCVNWHMQQSVDSLLHSQTRLFDFFIQDRMIHPPKTELTRTIRTYQDREKRFYKEVKQQIETSFSRHIEYVLAKRLEVDGVNVLEGVKELEFKPITIGEDSGTNHVIKMCRLQVRDYVLMRVIEGIESEVKDAEEMFNNMAREQAKRISAEPMNRVDTTLQNHLAVIWRREDMNFDMAALKEQWVAGLKRSVRTKLQEKREDIQFRVTGLYLDAAWKKETAAAVLRSIDPHTLTGHILDALKDKLESDHNQFIAAMNKISTLCNYKEKRAHAHRKQLEALVPSYSHNLCITQALHNTLVRGHIQLGTQIAQGSRMLVYDCEGWADRSNMVVKKLRPVSAEQVDGENSKEQSPSCEFYPHKDFSPLYCYTRMLHTDRTVMKVDSIAFDELWHFCIIIPKYDGTLYDFLVDQNDEVNLEERISLCLDLARMCIDVGTSGFRIADLRPNSIMVRRKDGKVTVAFNLSKWKDEHAPYPDGGIPFHFAPKMLNESNHSSTSGHRQSGHSSRHSEQNIEYNGGHRRELGVHSTGHSVQSSGHSGNIRHGGHKSADFSMVVILVLMYIGKYVRPKFSSSKEAYEALLSRSNDQTSKQLWEEFRRILDENRPTDVSDDIHRLVCEIVRKFLRRFFTSDPGDKGELLRNITHLHNRLGDGNTDGEIEQFEAEAAVKKSEAEMEVEKHDVKPVVQKGEADVAIERSHAEVTVIEKGDAEETEKVHLDAKYSLAEYDIV